MLDQTRAPAVKKRRYLRDPNSYVGNSNLSSCPSQYDSDEHREKSESRANGNLPCGNAIRL